MIPVFHGEHRTYGPTAGNGIADVLTISFTADGQVSLLSSGTDPLI